MVQTCKEVLQKEHEIIDKDVLCWMFAAITTQYFYDYIFFIG